MLQNQTTSVQALAPVPTGMDPKLHAVLDYLKHPVVNFNLQDIRLWGVSFAQTAQNEWSAIIASKIFVAAVRNIQVVPPGAFFSYPEDCFLTQSPFPRTNDDLLAALYSGFNTPDHKMAYSHILGFPLNHMINRLEGDLTTDQRNLSRLIIAATPRSRERHELIGRFSGMPRVFKSDKAPKPFVATSGISPLYIDPDLTYLFIVTKETDSCYECHIIEPFAPAKIGMIYSSQGFIPDNLDAINRLQTVPANLKVSVPLMTMPDPAEPPFFPSHHVDADAFHSLLRMMVLSEADIVNLHLTHDPNAPIFLSTQEKPGFPHIDVMLATINANPNIGPQRK